MAYEADISTRRSMWRAEAEAARARVTRDWASMAGGRGERGGREGGRWSKGRTEEGSAGRPFYLARRRRDRRPTHAPFPLKGTRPALSKQAAAGSLARVRWLRGRQEPASRPTDRRSGYRIEPNKGEDQQPSTSTRGPLAWGREGRTAGESLYRHGSSFGSRRTRALASGGRDETRADDRHLDVLERVHLAARRREREAAAAAAVVVAVVVGGRRGRPAVVKAPAAALAAGR